LLRARLLPLLEVARHFRTLPFFTVCKIEAEIILRRGVMLKPFFADQIFARRQPWGVSMWAQKCFDAKHLTADACLARSLSALLKTWQKIMFFRFISWRKINRI
jgi:hypothetical protein